MAWVSKRNKNIQYRYSLLLLHVSLCCHWSFGFNRVSNYGAINYGLNGNGINIHQDLVPYSSHFGNGNFQVQLSNGLNTANIQHTLNQAIPISQHVEVTKPVAVPIIKNFGKISFIH